MTLPQMPTPPHPVMCCPSYVVILRNSTQEEEVQTRMDVEVCFRHSEVALKGMSLAGQCATLTTTKALRERREAAQSL